MTLPIANGHPRSAGMTLPIANGLAGSAGQALPRTAVCDWEGIADLHIGLPDTGSENSLGASAS
jgi:hypothetical protein